MINLHKQLKDYAELVKTLQVILHYHEVLPAINDWREKEWAIDAQGEQSTPGLVYVKQDPNDDIFDYEGFTVSSMGNTGDKTYDRYVDDLYVFMGYREDFGWYSAEIYIMSMDKEIK